MDFIGDLADVLLRDPKFSMFARVLYKANFVQKLQNDKYLTIFAPTNTAFHRLSRQMKEKLRLDRKVAEGILITEMLITVKTLLWIYCVSSEYYYSAILFIIEIFISRKQ